MAFIATAIMEPTSETVAGRMRVLVVFANSPNLRDVLFRHAQLNGFLASRHLNRLGDLAQPFSRGLGNGEDGCSRSFCLVDLLLLLRLGGFDDLLFLALGLVDRRVALALGRENHRALFPLRPHLLFHRVQHALRGGDVLNFVPEDFDAPGIRSLVEFVHDLDIDVGPLLERPVEFDLADLAPQGGLRQAGSGRNYSR